ncbi:formamidopyrimidine-DNA glycosylase [Metamycoplasma hyosynoviae]|uniref:DNA-(apurinic or apyrimidinic site) lyase n=1 Tax=Metamycoplasma hyosynoviae TaxID=29559 RepID=A0A9Q9F2U2_9BACT|nr:DNA-formamidopyrimidine glycosylase [Metamycoplasma hyosynoviae]KDE41516.1 formamidopyrimidine-DNA glycosylase [Metamycoplasma hyosynoviae]KDE43005.1 formamidopyrimidine-DNA glycosylase [Metamycoplasma hyosynoviae]KDE43596.1 formamidopyrimidine-DNA glycosylase [Metamycoplasma hyosynoviae]KDE44302.1 formamidopyrimidine-DNA glycosylase [Metamycoplasma hyosynoviae]MDC8918584.1 DNA-formamidopyrimidine glycosylase [Metamycoplasma hyosynoviae]
MPELPEVRVVVDNLNTHILNKKIKQLTIFKHKLFKKFPSNKFQEEIVGKKFLKVENKGKVIIATLSNGLYLYSHLRMEGKYKYFNHINEITTTRNLIAIFEFEDQTVLAYYDSRMFGEFYLYYENNPEYIKPYAHFADEPDKVDSEKVYKKLSNSTQAIKTKIMSQDVVAGIGNIYADEILFELKIHPETPSMNLKKEQVKQILEVATKIMNKSYEHGGTTIHSFESFNDKSGHYQDYLMIHNSQIKFCKVCNTKVEKIFVNNRGTYFCPNCQKLEK